MSDQFAWKHATELVFIKSTCVYKKKIPRDLFVLLLQFPFLNSPRESAKLTQHYNVESFTPHEYA